MEQRRKIFFYGNYYHDFYKKLDNSVKKKTQKTPKNEITKAEKLKKKYYEQK